MNKLFLLCWLILPLYLPAQLSPEQALKVLDEKYPPEKLHIFTDREEYVAGETVFFKAYLFSGYVRSLISSTVYVEVYTDEVSLVSRLTIPMWNAAGAGSFELPESLPEGVYHIRAYTKWMLNFDPAFFYKSTFVVYNPASANKLAEKPVGWTATVFPESGVLLAGEENKVVVRLTAKGRLPQRWQGVLVNKADPSKPLVTFTSLTPDVAAFLFTPEANNAYEVHIKDYASNATTIAIAPQNTGVLLQAEQTGKEVYVSMVFKGLPEAGLNYKLVAHMQQQLVLSSVVRKKQETVKASIPVEKLMTGILHLTLFDPQNKPVAERMVFVDKESEMQKRGEKQVDTVSVDGIVMKIDSVDHLNYAVSVTPEFSASDRKRNIYTDMWWGDLARMPENSAVYFTGKPEDLLSRDALLITETWSRFQWDEILKNKFPAIKDSAEEYISYKGMATRNNKAVANEMLTLMLRFPDSTLQFLQVKTDGAGVFHLDNVVFYDSVKVYYQPAKAKGSNGIDIRFERKNSRHAPPAVQLPVTSYQLMARDSAVTVSQMVMNAREQLKVAKAAEEKYLEMEEVKVAAERKTKKEQLNLELTSPLFQTQNEQVFDIMNDEPSIQSYANIFDWLDGRVAGLTFRIIGEGDPEHSLYNLELIGQRVPMMRDQTVSIFIDEIPTDLSAVYMLPTSEIAMVKVIKGYFVGASSGGAGGGAIAIYTRKAGLATDRKQTLPSGIITGYSPVKIFTTPAVPVASRNLFYWSVLPANSQGFITIDHLPEKGRYRITVTGFTQNAQPFYWEYSYGRK